MFKNEPNENIDDISTKNLIELLTLQEVSIEQNNKLNKLFTELDLLKKDLFSVKEINNKNKDLLLLELESNLDKQKQFQSKQKLKVDSYQEIIKLFKEDNSNKCDEISSLNIEIGKLKQLVSDKNNLIENLKLNINELNKYKENYHESLVFIDTLKNQINDLMLSIKNKDKEIISFKKDYDESLVKIENLNDNLCVSEDIISNKNSIISELKENLSNVNSESLDKSLEINKLKHQLSRNDEELTNLNNDFLILNSKIIFLENELNEKEDTMESLAEEVKVLKDIIAEKDKTINYLNGGVADGN